MWVSILRYSILVMLLCLITEADRNSMRNIFSTDRGEFIDRQTLVKDLLNYDIIVFGEKHDSAVHHKNQLDVISEVAKHGSIDVGLEFVSWIDQGTLDLFLNGGKNEADFLKAMQWGKTSFAYYEPLIEIAVTSGGRVYGINAPNALVHKIAMQGLCTLSEQEKKLLPEDFSVGGDLYYKRFKSTMKYMKHDMLDGATKNFFAAHSVWDDTMAYHSLIDISRNKFFIIVGNFHAEYKLGLTARLNNRSPDKKIATIVQATCNRSANFTILHPTYGAIADYIIFDQ